MAKPELTAERLRELLHYEPETGIFTWLVSNGKRAKVGAIAGTTTSDGYVAIGIGRAQYQAHRLAWLYMTGEWPPHMIDHENTIRTANWWKNLRLATNAQNMQNLRKALPNNKCGMLGVSQRNTTFSAQIKVGGKKHYLGSFDTPELAHAAYLEAKARMHPYQTLTAHP